MECKIVRVRVQNNMIYLKALYIFDSQLQYIFERIAIRRKRFCKRTLQYFKERLFRIRHYLNDSLRNRSGHIGYQIHHNFRNGGYASIGLTLAIKLAKKIITEDEIYMAT